MLISLTPTKLYKLLLSLKGTEASGFYFYGWIFILKLPTVIIPPFEARHNENIRFSPFQGECLLNSYSNKLDYRLGASPKIPLAF